MIYDDLSVCQLGDLLRYHTEKLDKLAKEDESKFCPQCESMLDNNGRCRQQCDKVMIVE